MSKNEVLNITWRVAKIEDDRIELNECAFKPTVAYIVIKRTDATKHLKLNDLVKFS
jgi:hypothetical protein